VLAGQPAAAERAPRDDAETFVAADRQKFPFDLAVEEIVERLQAGEGLPASGPAEVDRFLQLPAAVIAGAEIADLALPHEVVDAALRLLEGRVRVPHMDLVEVDIVGLEPAEARLDFRHDVLAAEAEAVGAAGVGLVGAEAYLGGNDQALAVLALHPAA